jgi:hypothetical protein
MSKPQGTAIEWLTWQRKIAEDNCDNAAAILQKEREIVIKNQFLSMTSTPVEVPEYIIPFIETKKGIEAPSRGARENSKAPVHDDNEDRLNATSPAAPNTSYSNPDVESEKAQLKRLLEKYSGKQIRDRNGNSYWECNL